MPAPIRRDFRPNEDATVQGKRTGSQAERSGSRTRRGARNPKTDESAWLTGCTGARPMSQTRKRILLVDDSSTALMIEKMLLAKAPYEVITARDGHEGVRKAVTERPDLILMDVVMPTMTGLQACRRSSECDPEGDAHHSRSHSRRAGGRGGGVTWWVQRLRHEADQRPRAPLQAPQHAGRVRSPMAANRDVLGEYVRQVRESTQRYARDLLSENEKLLGFATTVHAEKVRLEEQVEALKAQLERHRGVERSLIEQMSALEQASQELSSRYLTTSSSRTRTSPTCTFASYGGIHRRSLEREEVVRAIHEVLINLVGTEDCPRRSVRTATALSR